MRLGGSIVGNYSNIGEWEELLVRSRFRAITAPFNCHTPPEEIRQYISVAERHDVAIAEIGVWKNVMDPDPKAAAEAIE